LPVSIRSDREAAEQQSRTNRFTARLLGKTRVVGCDTAGVIHHAHDGLRRLRRRLDITSVRQQEPTRLVLRPLTGVSRVMAGRVNPEPNVERVWPLRMGNHQIPAGGCFHQRVKLALILLKHSALICQLLVYALLIEAQALAREIRLALRLHRVG